MNLLEKLRMFNRELVKENARLTKIYANMCESAKEVGTDLDELDEGLGKAVAGVAIGSLIGAGTGFAADAAHQSKIASAGAEATDAARAAADAQNNLEGSVENLNNTTAELDQANGILAGNEALAAEQAELTNQAQLDFNAAHDNYQHALGAHTAATGMRAANSETFAGRVANGTATAAGATARAAGGDGPASDVAQTMQNARDAGTAEMASYQNLKNSKEALANTQHAVQNAKDNVDFAQDNYNFSKQQYDNAYQAAEKADARSKVADSAYKTQRDAKTLTGKGLTATLAGAGGIAGGAYGALDNDEKKEERTDEAEDGMQDFNSFVQGAQSQNESEYSKYHDDRDPDTGYVGPIKMSGEELFSEGDDDNGSTRDDDKQQQKPEISDEEFFSPVLEDEGRDIGKQIDDFFAESIVDEDDILTSRPSNGNGIHAGHRMQEGQSIPAGKFLGLVNEADADQEAAQFFKENDDGEDLFEDEDSNIPQDEFLAPVYEREHEIDELDKGEMMDYDEFYNTDGNSDTVEDNMQNESLKSFRSRR